MVELYQLVQKADTEFLIRKFDEDFNLKSEWDMHVGSKGGVYCGCWQGAKGWCRHKEMWREFQATGHINDGWFYNRSTGQWQEGPNG